jgi:hypothetical protein
MPFNTLCFKNHQPKTKGKYMKRQGIIERRNEKSKPRGRPFEKGNKKGKLAYASKALIKEEPRQDKHTLRSDKTPEEQETINTNPLNELPRLVTESTDTMLKETVGALDTCKEGKDLELIEKIEFSNGPNKLIIKYSKKHNRMYRIQVFLNDEFEVRPVTYSGSSAGNSFWNLLKGALKK